MPINPWIANNFIDSCAFDPKYDPEDISANEIFQLHKERNLGIQIAHSNQKEIEHPNTPRWVKEEASGLIYTLDVSTTSNEKALLTKILAILAGQGRPENMSQDARHIFDAQKYGSYFVTTDGRLLKKAQAIQNLCSVDILLPSEFLKLVKRYQVD